jgi:hypothetical protein
VYARNVKGKTLTLGVSGLLLLREDWGSSPSLVMWDTETGTLWSHLLGVATSGQLKGLRLEQIPSAITDWKSWQKEHPHGSVAVLSRTTTEYVSGFVERADWGQFVLGIADDDRAKAWNYLSFRDNPLFEDEWNGQPVVAVFDRSSMTARLFQRQLGEKILSFEFADGDLRDKESGSTWEPTSGIASAGPFAGRHLHPLPAIVSYRNAWFQFHPKSEEIPPIRPK